jgi:hypothetical protein
MTEIKKILVTPETLYQNSKKICTCLLLLAILAVSLTYRSGLNPPGGFWSGSAKNHLPGDRILEDNDHARFIAFFHLNAFAFVVSLVMILVLLNKSVIEKVTKHRELQISMIVVLLSLTGSFFMGSCRDAKKFIMHCACLCGYSCSDRDSCYPYRVEKVGVNKS